MCLPGKARLHRNGKLRIPVKTTSDSDLCRPPIPEHGDHLGEV